MFSSFVMVFDFVKMIRRFVYGKSNHCNEREKSLVYRNNADTSSYLVSSGLI